jgi:predicted dehydrogenase
MVHENWRWQPWWREIRALQLQRNIGEFTSLYFRMRTGDGWGDDAYLARQAFFRDYPRLLVYETGVHFIDTFRFLLGEVTEVFASLRRLNPVIRGEETGQIFLRFDSEATAIFDANRYNETESLSPRYTFGELRIDGMRGHLTMDTEANIRIKPLGEPAYNHDYSRANVNFAGDCVFALERHFADCMLTGAPFESTGEDYLKTVRVVERVYESAAQNQLLKVSGSN